METIMEKVMAAMAAAVERHLASLEPADDQMALGHVPHVAMYLSLQLDSETLQEEVGGPPVESVHTHTAFPQPRSPEQGSVCTVCTCGRQWLRR